MTKDFANGERMMKRSTPAKVDRQNDTPQPGSSTTPSWQNRSYGKKALEFDTMPPIPQHFKDGSWMNRFGAAPSSQKDQGQTEQGKTGQGTSDKADSKQQLIAFGDESPITQDPITGLFVLIFEGVVYTGQKTLEAANDLLQQVLKSTNDGGEKKEEANKKQKKKKKQTKQTGKEGSTDAPNWAKGQKPREGESGKDFAKRLLDEKYGSGKYDTGPRSEYNKIKKYGDRHFKK